MNAPIARSAGWASLSLAVAVMLLSFLAQPIGATATCALAGLVLVAVFRPDEALLILAALSPLASILVVLADVKPGGIRPIEAMTLAYLTGWAAHRCIAAARMTVPQPLAWSAGTLILAALASAVVSAVRILTEQSGDVSLGLIDDWFRSYAVQLDPVTFSLHFAEGLLLLIAVTDTCARKPVLREAVCRMLVVGAAAAAAFNVLRIVNVAIPHEHPWREFAGLMTRLRVNVHYADVNAAGSYFALAWFMAAAIAARSRATVRAANLVPLVLITAGLWIAGSRLALAAVALVAASVTAHRYLRRRQSLIAVALLLMILVVSAAALMIPLGRHVAEPALAVRIRIGLATGAVAMAADYPVFGVGLGRFYDLSNMYVSVPNYILRENAHNNFLQILAELGVPGLLLFLAVLASAGAAARNSDSPLAWGVVAGLCAFLLTCIGGHPLLIPQVAFPFWIALGVCASSFPSTPPRKGVRIAGLIVTAIYAVTLPLRVVASAQDANLEHTSIGLSQWQRDPEVGRYRFAGGRATVFVPGSATAVRMRLRLGNEGAGTLHVRIFLNGREADRVVVDANDDWRDVRIILAGTREGRFSRIDLETVSPGQLTPLPDKYSDAGGILAVSQIQVER